MDILFKAKRLDNGEWIECGSIVQFMDDGVRSVFIPDRSMPWNCLHDEYTDNIEACSDFFLVKVDPETVCRYTGMTDKNGVDIFDGDICLYREDQYTVIYDTNDGMFVIEDDTISIHFGNIWANDIEVIGNIHDKEDNNAQ